MKTCVTHHHACDCREEKFTREINRRNDHISRLEAALAEARKGLEFYGDKESWKVCEQYRPWNNYAVIKDDADIKTVDEGKMEIYCGKTARAALSKIDELLKTNQNT